MKKTYMQPHFKVTVIKLERMIAASPEGVTGTISTDAINSGSVDARRRGGWDDDWDDDRW